jgi:hypothetical protein
VGKEGNEKLGGLSLCSSRARARAPTAPSRTGQRGKKGGTSAHIFHDHVRQIASARPRAVEAPVLCRNVQDRLGRGRRGAG